LRRVLSKGFKLQDIKDANGFAFGEMMKTAMEGQVSEITYMWPSPASEQPQKLTYCTRLKWFAIHAWRGAR
jgi:hypothetical protein